MNVRRLMTVQRQAVAVAEQVHVVREVAGDDVDEPRALSYQLLTVPRSEASARRAIDERERGIAHDRQLADEIAEWPLVGVRIGDEQVLVEPASAVLSPRAMRSSRYETTRSPSAR